MARYEITQQAEDALQRIYSYGCEQYGLTQANKYYDKIFDYFEKIAKNPFMYQAADHIRKGYRRCVCGTDSIYYRITQDDIVEIVAILGRQDTEDIF